MAFVGQDKPEVMDAGFKLYARIEFKARDVFDALPEDEQRKWVWGAENFTDDILDGLKQKFDEKEMELLQSCMFMLEMMPNTPLPGRNLINLIGKLANVYHIDYDYRYDDLANDHFTGRK